MSAFWWMFDTMAPSAREEIMATGAVTSTETTSVKLADTAGDSVTVVSTLYEPSATTADASFLPSHATATDERGTLKFRTALPVPCLTAIVQGTLS